MEDVLDDNIEHSRKFTREDIPALKNLRNEAHQLITQVRQGRGMFVVLTVLALIATGIGYFALGATTEEGLGLIIEGIFLAIVYGICAAVYPKNPKVTLIVGFSFYILIFVASIIVDPEVLTRGMFMRIFIIYFFVKSINAALKLPKAIEALKKEQVPSYWIKKAEKLEDLPMTGSLLKN